MDDVRAAASRLGVFHFAAGFQTRAPTSEQARRQAGRQQEQPNRPGRCPAAAQ